MSKYYEKLKDPRWQKVRLMIFERDSFSCQDCGGSDKTLHVHHSHYQKGEPWDTEPKYLKSLCEKCHKRRGDLEQRAKDAIGHIFTCLACAADDDTLKCFVEDLERLSIQDPSDVKILSYDQWEYDTDVVWWQYAFSEPKLKLRQAYERIKGRSPCWGKK